MLKHLEYFVDATTDIRRLPNDLCPSHWITENLQQLHFMAKYACNNDRQKL